MAPAYTTPLPCHDLISVTGPKPIAAVVGAVGEMAVEQGRGVEALELVRDRLGHADPRDRLHQVITGRRARQQHRVGGKERVA